MPTQPSAPRGKSGAQGIGRVIILTTSSKVAASGRQSITTSSCKSAHAFICTGFTRGMRQVVTLDEFYLKKEISPKELESCFVEFAARCKNKYKRVWEAYCDSAETTLINGLRIASASAGLGIDIIPAIKGRITDRIRFYNQIMARGRYKILRKCVNIREAFESAVWDSKSIVDKRLDDGRMNVDSLDAQEYSTEKYMRDILGVSLQCLNT